MVKGQANKRRNTERLLIPISGIALLLVLFFAATHWPKLQAQRITDGDIPRMSHWRSFTHDVYPYQIRYPDGGAFELTYPDPEYQPGSFAGQVTKIFPVAEDGSEAVTIFGDAGTNSPSNEQPFDLAEYVANQSAIGDHQPNEVERVEYGNWIGHQYTDSSGEPITSLFIEHNGTLYIVWYEKSDATQVAIVRSLRFL